MKNLVTRKGNDLGFGLFDGLDNFFRPWFLEDFEMKTDIKESEKNYTLEMDLPGFDKKDIDMKLEDGYLRISACKNEASESEENGKYLRRERKYGSVTRSFYVGNLKEEDIDASYNNGVLTVTLPKEVPAKPEDKKRIEIK